MTKLILASTSKYRKQLLSQLHWDFETEGPIVDETIYKDQNLSPKDLAQKLSLLKASDVLSRNENALIIGSDQVCALGNTIFSKPQNYENAFKQIKKMSGKEHELLTAVTIMNNRDSFTWVNSTKLTMRELEDEDIKRYLKIDTPYDCAGSYKLEAMGIKLFEKIQMTDHTAIIGLPLIEITNVLISRFGLKF